MSMKSAACVHDVKPAPQPEPTLSLNRRGAVGVKGLERLQAPGLALVPFGPGPGDRAPVRRQHQPGDRVAQLDPVPARLVDVEEERLLDGVLVRSGLDENPVVQADVGGLLGPGAVKTPWVRQMAGARVISLRGSGANGAWCRRPRVPVQSRVYT